MSGDTQPRRNKGVNWKVFFPIAALWIGFGIYYDYHRSHKFEDQIRRMHLALRGVVRYVDYPGSSNGFGIIGVKILETNQHLVKRPDPPADYYCTIRNDSAELYQLGANDVKVGDTVMVDTDQSLFTVKSPNNQQRQEDIVIYTSERFWKFVQVHTRL